MARPEGQPGTASVAARSELVRLVAEVLDECPAPQREVLLLRFFEDLPPR